MSYYYADHRTNQFLTPHKCHHDAVRNGLSLPWNSGVVEGTVSKIKMIKRQIYGRASFLSLRKRVLAATSRGSLPSRNTGQIQIQMKPS